MKNIIEAIGITREFAQDAQEIDPRDPHFDFCLETGHEKYFYAIRAFRKYFKGTGYASRKITDRHRK